MYIVTGAAGFIGSNIVKGLNDAGIKDIILVDDLTDGTKHKNLNRLQFNDYVDYRDLMENLDYFNNIECIIHQGACSDTTESNGRYMMEVNYDYSKTLLHYCNTNNARFIYASSASVYGDGDNGFRESPECEYPLNVYAFSKYQFDRYVNRIKKDLNTQVVGLRYFNVYGPQENHKGKMASVAYHMFHQIKNGEDMKLFTGSDKFVRDFIHVDDVVKVNMFFVNNPKISGIFNCGTGKAESFVKIAQSLQKKYTNAKLVYVPFPEHLKGKYQEFTQADLTKLRSVGYKEPFMDVETGVLKYAEILEKSGGML